MIIEDMKIFFYKSFKKETTAMGRYFFPNLPKFEKFTKHILCEATFIYKKNLLLKLLMR